MGDSSKWGEVALGDLCAEDRLITYGIVKVGDFVPGGVPVVRGGDIRDNRIVFDDQKRVTREVSDQFQRTILRGGEIVMNLIAEPGHTAVVGPEFRGANVSRDVAVIPLNGAMDCRFVNFVLQSRQVVQWLRARLQGSVTQKINLSTLREVPIPVPPLDEQQRIAGVLGALDDKIELNRKMNRTLEAMAQAIFKSWFIDFDGVPASDMVESELGPIPKGWGIKPINEIVEVNPRTSLARGTTAPFVEMKGLSTSGCSVLEVGAKQFSGGGSKFMQDDTLLARITPCLENGKTALVDFLATDEVGLGSTEFIILRPSGAFSREWVYCLARSTEFREHAISNMTGSSGRQRVPADCFAHLLFPEPPGDLLHRFADATKPVFDKIKANADQARTLTDLRDALLPRLISGELRIPEAERAVEAAV